VVDVALRVAMGVLCTLNNAPVFGCVAADAPVGAAPITDVAKVDEVQEALQVVFDAFE
jgi:hypothetical protein